MGIGFGTDILANLAEGKPTIPNFTPIDLGASQTKAIQSNTNSLPDLENLGSKINQFNVDELEKMLNQVIPGYEDLTKGVTSNIQDLLNGKIPQDVQDRIQNSAAARAISGGYGGSGMHSNLVARDLGLTSLDLTGKGMSAAEDWISRMGALTVPGQFNVASMFITPQQQFAASVEERNAQFQHDYVSNLNDWQHSFGTAVGTDIRNTGNTVMQLLSSYLGGGGFGGGGGGGGAELSGQKVNYPSSEGAFGGGTNNAANYFPGGSFY